METLKAMGHDCILDDRETKGSLAGASTDMGKQSNLFIHEHDLIRSKGTSCIKSLAFMPYSRYLPRTELEIIRTVSRPALAHQRATKEALFVQMAWL